MTLARCLILLLACALPALARAQAVVGAGVVSQYWVRGIPLSDGVAPQLSVNWDGEGGWFAGALVSRAELRRTEADALGVAYAGMARRIGPELSVEGGVSVIGFHDAGIYNYQEVFGGVTYGRTSARLYFSPRYYGVFGRSVYGEVNSSVPLGEHMELTLHAGRLHAQQGSGEYYFTPPAQSRTDVRIGVAGMWDRWSAHLSLVASRGDAAGYAASARRNALVAGVVRSF